MHLTLAPNILEFRKGRRAAVVGRVLALGVPRLRVAPAPVLAVGHGRVRARVAARAGVAAPGALGVPGLGVDGAEGLAGGVRLRQPGDRLLRGQRVDADEEGEHRGALG